MALLKSVPMRECDKPIEESLEAAGIPFTAVSVQHDGPATGETRRIVYTSPNTGETVFVKAVYGLLAPDAQGEALEYYDSDFATEGK